MNVLRFVLLVVGLAGLAPTFAADGAIDGPGDCAFSFEHGGKTRQYRVHVPPGFSADKPMPVVFALHGGGGTMDIQADDRFYGQISKPDAAGYGVVFPRLRGPHRLPRRRRSTR
jgi:polyhydroxybutyrate depolymerase